MATVVVDEEPGVACLDVVGVVVGDFDVVDGCGLACGIHGLDGGWCAVGL
jgi:hypothetical protein